MTAAAQPGLLRTAHASGLNAVGRELGELHRAMLRSGGDETRGVRLSVLTLVAACIDEAAAELAAQTVAGVAGRHPARAIIVVARPDHPPGITADLSLQCSVGPGREQVCAEVVRLQVGGEAAFHLASVITPLLLPDVPVFLWLVGAVPLGQALRPDTLEVCERVILDSDAHPDPGAVLAELSAALDRREAVPVSDLAWSRTRPWREQLARAFDRSDLRPFTGEVTAVEIEAGGAGDGAGAQALLLHGWLRSRLGNRLGTVTSRRHGGPAPGLSGVTLYCRAQGRAATVSVRRGQAGLAGEARVEGMAVGLGVAAPAPDDVSALVGAELEAQGPDPLHAAALRARPWAEAARR